MTTRMQGALWAGLRARQLLRDEPGPKGNP